MMASVKFWVMALIYKTIVNAQELYNYDEGASKEKTSNDGIRLVGAARGKTARYPFVVAFTTIAPEKGERAQCTGSVLSKDWILSAAHCFEALVYSKDEKICAEVSAQGGFFINKRNQTVKCLITENEDIKIYPIKPIAKAYIMMNEIGKEVSEERGEIIQIEYFVRHKNSYREHGYGTYGGYDITMAKLVSPTNVEPACIPTPDFKDSGLGSGYDNIQNVQVAGYGKYYRSECLTDELGPSVNHDCDKNSKCDTSQNPPISPECKEFLANNPEVEKEFSSKNLHKIVVQAQDKWPVDCFRKTSYQEGSEGWCSVSEDATQIGKLSKISSWGFCSRNCFLKKNVSNDEPNDNVFRSKENVDILDDELCNKFLMAALGKKNLKFVPELLCIGYYKKSNIKMYTVTPGGKAVAGPDEIYQYVTAAGVCHGDSGGPVFVKDEKSGKFVVLGVVSGGRGRLGHCGGMNNPTHYARVKRLAGWIKNAIGPDVKDVCEIGNPAGEEATLSNAILTNPNTSLTSLSHVAQNTAAVPLTNLGSSQGIGNPEDIEATLSNIIPTKPQEKADGLPLTKLESKQRRPHKSYSFNLNLI